MEVQVDEEEGITKGAHKMKRRCNKSRLVVYSDCENFLRNNDLSLFICFYWRAFLWGRCHFRFVYDEFYSPVKETQEVEGEAPLTFTWNTMSLPKNSDGVLMTFQLNVMQNLSTGFSTLDCYSLS